VFETKQNTLPLNSVAKTITPPSSFFLSFISIICRSENRNSPRPDANLESEICVLTPTPRPMRLLRPPRPYLPFAYCRSGHAVGIDQPAETCGRLTDLRHKTLGRLRNSKYYLDLHPTRNTLDFRSLRHNAPGRAASGHVVGQKLTGTATLMGCHPHSLRRGTIIKPTACSAPQTFRLPIHHD
jgi:hypothetical protein